MNHAKELARAASVIRKARSLIISSGSGMGVDSGLPDFRGSKGLWRAYPPLKKLNIDLPSMSSPKWFYKDPKFAWGFFGHRYNLYKQTEPHEGFQILRNWGEDKEYGYFVFTSNIDGHFQKAGFDEDKICECHGSINYLQLVNVKNNSSIWPVPHDLSFDVDEETLQLQSELPLGPPENPSELARPNVLMFGDWDWISDRTDKQEQNYYNHQIRLQDDNVSFVVIEIGSGVAVPTVRSASEGLIGRNSVLIRINPNEPAVPNPGRNIAIPMHGLEALHQIDQMINSG